MALHPTFAMFGASSVSAGMKAQTSIRSATSICTENWKFQQHPKVADIITLEPLVV
jgi:hypothetical protein